jgi:hypothetical protein
MPRNVVVLAKHAAQIAAAEEDRSGAALTAEAVLLAEVGEVGRHDGMPADCAEALDVVAPVNLAAARANDAARPEQLVRLRRASVDLGGA